MLWYADPDQVWRRFVSVLDEERVGFATLHHTPWDVADDGFVWLMLGFFPAHRTPTNLEAGLVLMTDDGLREAFLSGRPVTSRKRGRRSPSLLKWLSLALDQLARTNRIDQDIHEDMPFIKLGPAAGDTGGEREYHEKAARAIEVIGRLGEQQTREAVEESVDETASLVPV